MRVFPCYFLVWWSPFEKSFVLISAKATHASKPNSYTDLVQELWRELFHWSHMCFLNQKEIWSHMCRQYYKENVLKIYLSFLPSRLGVTIIICFFFFWPCHLEHVKSLQIKKFYVFFPQNPFPYELSEKYN